MAQLKDLSADNSSNYILSNINKVDYLNDELYNGSLFVSVFTMSDSRLNPEGLFNGTDEVLSSVLISIIPDGDYYTSSKLYKIEGLVAPEILQITETQYPELVITVESGFYKDRKQISYTLEGK
ncbi:MAG: hypothetical protein WCY16_10010 [Weeksellaceae bacterium]